MKTQHFNRIKKILNNEKNEAIHLPSLKNLVENYAKMFGNCKLASILWMQYFNIYIKLNLNT